MVQHLKINKVQLILSCGDSESRQHTVVLLLYVVMTVVCGKPKYEAIELWKYSFLRFC